MPFCPIEIKQGHVWSKFAFIPNGSRCKYINEWAVYPIIEHHFRSQAGIKRALRIVKAKPAWIAFAGTDATVAGTGFNGAGHLASQKVVTGWLGGAGLLPAKLAQK